METEARGLKSGETYDFNVKIREKESGLIKTEKTVQIMAEKAETGFKCELKVEDVRLWSTWDRLKNDRCGLWRMYGQHRKR